MRHKHLGEVEFVEVVPKSASGKILRRLLRDGGKGERKKGVVVRETERAKL